MDMQQGGKMNGRKGNKREIITINNFVLDEILVEILDKGRVEVIVSDEDELPEPPEMEEV